VYKDKEEVAARMREIQKIAQEKLDKSEELKISAIIDKGRLKELMILYNMLVEEEGGNDEA